MPDILGSAIVELEIHDHHITRRLVFSGDLGNACSPLMQDPTLLDRADVVLMESTYGDRDHRCSERPSTSWPRFSSRPIGMAAMC